MGKHFNAELYRQFDHHMDRGLDDAMGDTDAPLTEEERAAQWETFEQFRDDKCLREVDTLFDRVFGVLR